MGQRHLRHTVIFNWTYFCMKYSFSLLETKLFFLWIQLFNPYLLNFPDSFHVEHPIGHPVGPILFRALLYKTYFNLDLFIQPHQPSQEGHICCGDGYKYSKKFESKDKWKIYIWTHCSFKNAKAFLTKIFSLDLFIPPFTLL